MNNIQSISLFPLALATKNTSTFTTSVPTLLAISHSIENTILHHRLTGTFYAGFQRFSAFLPQINRFTRLAATCGQVLVFGYADVPTPEIPNLRYVRLDELAPLNNEWFIVFDAAPFSVALLTKQISTGIGGTVKSLEFGRGRDYEGTVTFEVPAVVAARKRLEGVMGIEPPTIAERTLSLDPQSPYGFYNRSVVNYLERSHQQLLGLFHTVTTHTTELERQQTVIRTMLSQTAWENATADAAAAKGAATETRTYTVLFSDIEGFTRFSESLPPEELFRALNRYFDMLASTVYQMRGDIDKFLGDGMLAFFEQATHALEAALLIQKRVETFNAQQIAHRQPPFKTRIGLATGPCLLGRVGSRARQEFTLIGGVVNYASRLQAIAPTGGVVLDTDTYHACGSPPHFTQSTTNIRGKTGPQIIYHPPETMV